MKRWMALVASLTLSMIDAAGAAGVEQTSETLELHVTPSFAAPGATIAISGHAETDTKHAGVRITVTNPSSHGTSSIANAGSDGSFTSSYRDTKAAGIYRVDAISPDGKARAAATFTIGGGGQLGDSVARDEQALVDVANEAESTAEQTVESLPASPAQADLKERLAVIKQRLAQAPAQLDAVKKAYAKIGDAAVKTPVAQQGPFNAFYARVDAWRADSERETSRAREQLRSSAARGAKCDRLDSVSQALGLISTLLDFFGKPADIAKSLAYDKAWPSAAGIDPNGGPTFAAVEAVKGAAVLLLGPAAWAAGFAGILADVSAHALDAQFAKYCERISGPVRATARIEFYDGGRKWWSYDEQLDGTLTLRYAKDAAPGGAVHMSGEIVGYGTKFGLWEDFSVTYPRLRKSGMLLHRAIAPSGTSASSPAGAFAGKYGQRLAGAVGGDYFEIPVTADLVKTDLTIHVQPARTDLDVHGRVVYIYIPLGSPAPETLTFKTPYQTAYWIITRAIGANPKYTLAVSSSAQRANSAIVRKYERDAKGSDGSYAVHFTGDVHACNPGC